MLMHFPAALLVLAVAFLTVDAASIDHDKVKPFDEPDAVTAIETLAVRFKPMILFESGCVAYPAVNAAGETSGGLRGVEGKSECEGSPMGTQVYVRAARYEPHDVWAIMYAWYFPKGFWGKHASRRHDWANVIVWTDNPDVINPTDFGLVASKGDGKYHNLGRDDFAGTHRLSHHLRTLGQPSLDRTRYEGHYQSMIMWENLTEEARVALNTADFGRAKVPLNDDNFREMLDKAWPKLDKWWAGAPQD